MAPIYTTEDSQTHYFLNTAKLNFTQAETVCALNGGHLAAFLDKDEQVKHPACWLCACLLPCSLPGLILACVVTWGRNCCPHPRCFESLQIEVEQYYTNLGYILPDYHAFYWMGLNSSTDNNTNFSWLTPDINSMEWLQEYSHWGNAQPQNNYEKLCAGGNFNLTVDGAWGWANNACQLPYISICRIMRELPPIKISEQCCAMNS